MKHIETDVSDYMDKLAMGCAASSILIGFKVYELVNRLTKYETSHSVSFWSKIVDRQSCCVQYTRTSLSFQNGTPKRFIGCITTGQQLLNKQSYQYDRWWHIACLLDRKFQNSGGEERLLICNSEGMEEMLSILDFQRQGAWIFSEVTQCFKDI